MKADDLRFIETAGTEGKFGLPHFGPYRLMILSIASFNKLMRDLRKSIDPRQLSIIMARFGYHIGMTTAMAAAEQYDFDSPEEWLRAGSRFRNFAGIAHEVIDDITMNREKEVLRFTGSWRESFELVHQRQLDTGKANEPSCILLQSLASGFASAVFGSEVLVKEIECRSQGHECCRFEGRSALEWGMAVEEIRALFDLSPYEEETRSLRKKLDEAQASLLAQKAEVERLKALVTETEFDDEVVFKSKSMAELLKLAQKVAPTDSTVLIQGDSGTGKEVIARFIHRHSNRMSEPFVDISCGALPANLLESELFGHVRGAFTGAEKNNTGLLVEAGNGTVFLDEVGELPLDLQVKLLRVLQEKVVRPVGSANNIPIKARILAATNRNLREMVEHGEFREDLYYRLAVFPLHIKTLSERKPDILPLAHHFLGRLNPNHFGFSPETIRAMENYHWPGNVRELENCVEYALILAGEHHITPDFLPISMKAATKDLLTDLASDLPTYSELEKQYTQFVLEHTNGNKTKAAKILGTSPTTLWRRLKQ